MNQFFLKKILIFIVCTSTFIKVSSMAPGSGASRLLANNRFLKTTSLQNQTRPYSSQIPLKQSNNALQRVLEEEEPKSKKSSWYQGKWKYPLAAGTAAGAAYEMSDLTNAYAENLDQLSENQSSDLNTKFQEIKKSIEKEEDDLRYNQYLTKEIRINQMINSKDAKYHDPELYKLFFKIKKDLGIIEDIDLRIGNSKMMNDGGLYDDQSKTIFLHENYITWQPVIQIKVLAHELGHVKQFHHYPDSYHYHVPNKGFSWPLEGKDLELKLKSETGADANAAGYFDCPECLRHIAAIDKKYPLFKHNPVNLSFGYFTTKYGYFSPEDYELYMQRACLDGELCEAHSAPKIKIIDKSSPEKFDSYWNQKQIKNRYNRLYNQQVLRNVSAELFLPKTEPKK